MKNKKIREAADTLLCVFVTLLILYFVCRPFTIDGYSMEPALHDGDRVVVSKVLALVGDIKRSDIVVCRVALITASGANGGLETLVKRVVGLPGERVTITGGAVYLNGDVLTEPYLGNNSTDGEIDIVLSDGEYFILGDNRDVSYDSRKAGSIAADVIIGKVIAKWYPFNNVKIYSKWRS